MSNPEMDAIGWFDSVRAAVRVADENVERYRAAATSKTRPAEGGLTGEDCHGALSSTARPGHDQAS